MGGTFSSERSKRNQARRGGREKGGERDGVTNRRRGGKDRLRDTEGEKGEEER